MPIENSRKAFSPRPPTLNLATRLALALVAVATAAPAQPPTTWRYNLHPGDHLVYSYSFHREVDSDGDQTTVEATFHTHILIAGERNGVLSAGFQRDRDNARLLAYHVKGKDKLATERPKFEKRMQARPKQFSEAMEFTASGEPRYSWETARESPSHLLPDLHEIEILPPGQVKVGDRWHAMDLLGLEFEWTGTEQVHGKSCNRVRGTAANGSVTLTYWWSPESGVIERIQLDGTYSVFGGTSHEQASVELESLSRSEAASDWLAKPETRSGALDALLLSPWVPVAIDQLSSALKAGDPATQRLALALAYRRGQPLEAVMSTLANANPEIKAFATALLTPPASKPQPTACPQQVVHKPTAPKTGTLLRVALAQKSGPNIPYFLRIPDTYRGDHPLPLLVYLSGGAGFALDGVNTANDAIANTDYLVLYPQAGEYWWKPEVADRLNAAMRDVFNDFNVDHDRIYIAGFSNGGTGSLYMAERWPDRFAAVVSLMGAGQCVPDVQKDLENLANLPILFVHGEKDEVISPTCSQATYDTLSGLRPRVAPQLKLLPDREHELTLQSDDGLTLAFFKDKVCAAFPKRLSFQFGDLSFPRQYWIEVLEKKSGVAEVTAELKKDNRIEIHTREVKKVRLHLRPEMFSEPGPVRIVWNGKQVYEGPLKETCAVASPANPVDPKLDLADTIEFSLP